MATCNDLLFTIFGRFDPPSHPPTSVYVQKRIVYHSMVQIIYRYSIYRNNGHDVYMAQSDKTPVRAAVWATQPSLQPHFPNSGHLAVQCAGNLLGGEPFNRVKVFLGRLKLDVSIGVALV